MMPWLQSSLESWTVKLVVAWTRRTSKLPLLGIKKQTCWWGESSLWTTQLLAITPSPATGSPKLPNASITKQSLPSLGKTLCNLVVPCHSAILTTAASHFVLTTKHNPDGLLKGSQESQSKAMSTSSKFLFDQVSNPNPNHWDISKTHDWNRNSTFQLFGKLQLFGISGFSVKASHKWTVAAQWGAAWQDRSSLSCGALVNLCREQRWRARRQLPLNALGGPC